MGFAINIALRGAQAVRSTMIAIRDTIVGSAVAEERLERAAVRAEKAQRKLAAAAKETARAMFTASANAQAMEFGRGGKQTGRFHPNLQLDHAGLTGESRAATIRQRILRQLATQGASDQAAAQANRAASTPPPRGGRFAQALSRVGGAAGAVLGRVGGALGSPSPGLVALGLGAAAVGIALQEFGKAVDRNKEAVRQAAEIQYALTDAQRDAVKAANAEAIGVAKGSRSALLTLAAAGGDALGRGRDLAGKVGPGGLDAAGKLQQFGMFNGQTSAALQAAVGTGRITPEQFAETLTKHRGLASGGRDANSLASAVIAASGGGRVNVAATNAALQGNGLAGQFAQLDNLEGRRQGIAVDRFSRGALGDVATDLGRFASPESAARQQMWEQQERQLMTLNKIADGQNWLERIYDAIANRGDSASNTAARQARIVTTAIDG